MSTAKRALKNVLKRLPFARDFVSSISSGANFAKKVSSPAHNQIALSSDGMPVPPIQMRDKVRKSAILVEDFLLEGRQAFDAIHQFLAGHGISLASKDVYEFGSGCGRIARYFIDLDIRQFIGSDVDEEMIDWSTANLASEQVGKGKVRFFTNQYSPPVPLDTGSVDLIYSISVFTHMDEKAQLAWAAEAHRVLRPGGHLLMSILERSESELPEGIRVEARVDKEFTRSWLGKGDAPKVYYNTYNSVPYLARKLQSSFDLVGQSKNAIRNKQSLILFRKRD